MTVTRLVGDSRDVLATLPEKHFHCCVTSPPYYNLRDYGGGEQEIGREKSLDCLAWARNERPCGECYVCALLSVFGGKARNDGVWRVLRGDGVFSLNVADSYADKNLCMAPARLALALQSAGWYVRCDVIWQKVNAMPGSQQDRCTSSHEHVWMLTKSERYYFDNVAILEPLTCPAAKGVPFGGVKHAGVNGNATYSGNAYNAADMAGRTKRDVWSIPTKPCSSSHFAVMPSALVEPCVLSSTSERGCCSECGSPWKRMTKVTKEHGLDEGWEASCTCADAVIYPCRTLDPFGGSGTVALVSAEHGRDCTLIDLVPHNMEQIAVNRLKRVQPRLSFDTTPNTTMTPPTTEGLIE